MKSEEKAEIILWDWLITKNDGIKKIYFNRKNQIGWKTFKVKGCQEKPDFILDTEKGYIAIEIKSSEKSKSILQSDKIIDYFKNYSENKTEYYVEDQKIKIKYFLVASDNSPKGFLFENETFIDNLNSTSKSKSYVASLGLIPKQEGNRTFEFVRILWNSYGKIRSAYEEKCGLGILIADLNENNYPKMMITTYYEDKKRWVQRFWRL
jgi:hypothetical protein